MAKVSKFPLSPTTVLVWALRAAFKRVMVIGVQSDGRFYAAGSHHSSDHLKDIETFQSKIESGDWDDPSSAEDERVKRYA